MGEVIVVTSGKGGVGKTTTTANIGAGLSRLDKKVVIIDTDLGLSLIHIFFAYSGGTCAWRLYWYAGRRLISCWLACLWTDLWS